MIKGKLLGFGIRKWNDKETKEEKKMCFANLMTGDISDQIGVGQDVIQVKAFSDRADQFFDVLMKGHFLDKEVYVDCNDFNYMLNKSCLVTLASNIKI